MAVNQTAVPDVVDQTLAFGLMLFDGFSGQNRLVGGSSTGDETGAGYADPLATTVQLAGQRRAAFQKTPNATYLFFDLPAGSHTVRVRSPYYLPRDIVVTLPMLAPRWPVFPDVTLADEDLPLDSPNQPVAYQAQRRIATLKPTASYPFPGDATLVRGLVRYAGRGLAGATVRRVGDGSEYVTEDDGEFVLFFFDVPRGGQIVTLQSTHPLHTTATIAVRAIGGETVSQDIAMA